MENCSLNVRGRSITPKDNSFSDDRAKAFAKYFGGKNVNHCDNLTSVDTLICHKPFNAKDGKVLYYKWPNNDRVDIDSCTWEEWRIKKC